MEGVDGEAGVTDGRIELWASHSQRAASISLGPAPEAPRCPAFKSVSSSLCPLSFRLPSPSPPRTPTAAFLSFYPCSLSSPRSRLSARLLPPRLITSFTLARLLHCSHTTRHAMANSQGTGTTLSDNSRSDLVEKPEDAEPQPPDLTPPDGGWTAWLTVAGACVLSTPFS